MGRQPRRAPEVVPNQERHRPPSLQTTDFGHVTRDGRIIQDGTYYRWSKKGDEIGMKGSPTPEGNEEKKDKTQKALWDYLLQATSF